MNIFSESLFLFLIFLLDQLTLWSVGFVKTASFTRIAVNMTFLKEYPRRNASFNANSNLDCAMRAASYDLANLVCFEAGVCSLYFEVYSVKIVTSGDWQYCYAKFGVKEVPKFCEQLVFPSGCLWLTDHGSWHESKRECQENSGDLMSFAYFEFEEFQNFVNQTGYKNEFYIDLQRKGLNADFLWSNGAVLERNSPLWGAGEPNGENIETSCANLWKGRVDDYLCTINHRGLCYFHLN